MIILSLIYDTFCPMLMLLKRWKHEIDILTSIGPCGSLRTKLIPKTTATAQWWLCSAGGAMYVIRIFQMSHKLIVEWLWWFAFGWIWMLWLSGWALASLEAFETEYRTFILSLFLPRKNFLSINYMLSFDPSLMPIIASSQSTLSRLIEFMAAGHVQIIFN